MTQVKSELKNIFKSAEVISYRQEAAMRSRAYIVLALFGLFLSGFIYVASNNYVTQVVKERAQTRANQTAAGYLARVQGYADKVDAIASSLETLPVGRINQIGTLQNSGNVLSELNPFNYVALFQVENGFESVKLLETNPQMSGALPTLQAVSINSGGFAGLVRQGRFNQADTSQVISSANLLSTLNQIGSTLNANENLVFIRRVNIANGAGQYWLLAEESASDIFGADFSVLQNHVHKVTVRDRATDQILYAHENRTVENTYAEQLQEVSFGGATWFMTMGFVKSNLVLLLEKVPFVGLFLGVLFTAVSSFLASAQLRQEGHIKQINHVLEEKNKALEREMDKREKLNWDLKKSEEENLALINSISDIIFETDSKGNLAFVNAAWGRITGFDVGQSRGKNLFNLLHPDNQLEEVGKFEQLVKGQKSAYRSYTRLRGIDGTFRAIELSISMVRRSAEGIVHVVGSITDVEERRRAEQALGEAEKKYRAIVENAAWGIYQMTPDGVYLSVNSAMVNILGYENKEDLLHTVHNAHEQVYGNKNERRAFLREIEVNGKVSAYETRVLNKSGDTIWVNENIRAVKDDDGNTLYYEGSFEDITDRKASDILLRDAKMHSDMANRAKSEFLTNMSHELRTPLNAIIGFSEIIKNESFGPLANDSYKEYIDEIHKGGKNLLHIINEILDISRIEVRARELNESTVSIPAVMNVCSSLLESKAHANQIDIVNLLENVPDIIGEERAMKQIFTNVLSNAIKFTPRGGRVTIRNEVTQAGDLSISFADTGVGLDVDEIKKALSPFGQVGSTLDTENAGTGLGLTLVKSLIELHDGKLDIFSQKGMGTTVTVQIPAKRIVQKPVTQSDSVAKTNEAPEQPVQQDAQVQDVFANPEDQA